MLFECMNIGVLSAAHENVCNDGSPCLSAVVHTYRFCLNLATHICDWTALQLCFVCLFVFVFCLLCFVLVREGGWG